MVVCVQAMRKAKRTRQWHAEARKGGEAARFVAVVAGSTAKEFALLPTKPSGGSASSNETMKRRWSQKAAWFCSKRAGADTRATVVKLRVMVVEGTGCAAVVVGERYPDPFRP